MFRKQKMFFVMLSIAFFLAPAFVNAAIIFETSEFMTESEGIVYEFMVDIEPAAACVATITDLSEDLLGFEYLYLTISTSLEVLGETDTNNPSGLEPINFTAYPGIQYYANVFGVGSGEYETGNFGLQIVGSAVPIPTTLFLLGSGLIGLIGLRQRKRNS
jgi:hypothetical protein